jgi:hypothetical protein
MISSITWVSLDCIFHLLQFKAILTTPLVYHPFVLFRKVPRGAANPNPPRFQACKEEVE